MWSCKMIRDTGVVENQSLALPVRAARSARPRSRRWAGARSARPRSPRWAGARSARCLRERAPLRWGGRASHVRSAPWSEALGRAAHTEYPTVNQAVPRAAHVVLGTD